MGALQVVHVCGSGVCSQMVITMCFTETFVRKLYTPAASNFQRTNTLVANTEIPATTCAAHATSSPAQVRPEASG